MILVIDGSDSVVQAEGATHVRFIPSRYAIILQAVSNMRVPGYISQSVLAGVAFRAPSKAREGILRLKLIMKGKLI